MAQKVFTDESLSTLVDEIKSYADSAVESKAETTALTSHINNTDNPHSVTAEQAGALPIAGGTLTGTLYTSASTPLVIGTDGKIGMGAKTDTENNVGQINISNAWYDTGTQWGAQMSVLNGETGKRNGLRVSHNGLEYTDEDEITHQVLHDGNVSEHALPVETTINNKLFSVSSENGTASIALTAADIGADTSGAADNALTSAKAYTDEVAAKKAAASHTHNYAGSSSAGGAANSANKLNTDAGSATQPVYFADGIPVATTYTLEASVPSGAKFTDTDTHYESKNVVGSASAVTNTTTALTNNNVYLNSVENGQVTSSHKISGSGATTVTTDANGNIVISSTDTDTTYSAAGSSLGLVKSGGDVTISSGVITVNDDSHNHTIANIDDLQTTLDSINDELDDSIKSLSVSGTTITYTKNDGSTGTITTQDKDTTYTTFVKSGSGAAAGLVPAPSTTAGTTKYLREDGTWAVPPDTDTNTDTKVNVTLDTTTKAYLLGTSTTPTSTAAGVTAIADTGVYLDTTAGQLVAKTFKGALSGNATTATSATSATKATQDANGDVITSTYETKTDAAAKLASANTYTDTALETAKGYTDDKIALLMDNSSEAIDSILELATAMEENEEVVSALNDAIGTKAAKDHTHTVSHTPAGTISQPTFTGTAVTSDTPSGSSPVASSGHTHSVTAAGTVSQPTFSGTKATIEATYTPVGSVSSTFTGSAATSGSPSATATVASSTHTHGYTPAGTVSKPTFTGTEATLETKYTPVGSISQPTFTGSAVTSGTPSATATVAGSAHTHSVTAAGTVSQPTFSGTAVTSGTPSATTSLYSITGVGSVPSLSASVANRCLTFTWSAGSVPTRSSVTVASSGHTHSVTAAGTVSKPTFTGSAVTSGTPSATATVAGSAHTHSVTATGTVSKPTFTGTEDTISITYTPAGTVSQPTFTGSAGTTSSISGTTSVAGSAHTHSVTAKGSVSSTFTGTEDTIEATYTPAGTVSKPTFTGSAVTSGTPSGTTSVASSSHTHSVTAAGTVSKPTFTGTAATMTTSTES